MGYGFSTTDFQISSNLYFTEWKDKAISKMISDVNTNQFYFYNLSGASARHMGIELTSTYHLFNYLKFEECFLTQLTNGQIMFCSSCTGI